MKTKKRQNRSPLPFQTPAEELANAILHGIGASLAIAGLVILIMRANGHLGGIRSSGRMIAAYAIYGTSMIVMFLASTLYHALTAEGAKRVLRVFDHCAIYLLIAGTYTPFCLGPLAGPWGWSLFGLEWGLAIIGATLYALGSTSLKKIEVAVYILMGWAVVMGWAPMVRALPSASFNLLIGGGLLYTAGTIWYRRKARRGSHVAWHVFVFGGAAAHWLAIFFLS